MRQEGVIRFVARHTSRPLERRRVGDIAAQLIAWRQILYSLGGGEQPKMNEVIAWDLSQPTRPMLHKLRRERVHLNSLSLSPDERLLALGT